MFLQGYGPTLMYGALQTLKISLASFAIGSMIGIIVAGMKLSPFRPISALATTYTTIIRGLPELLLLLMAYFGGTAFLSMVTGEYIEVDPFLAGVSALGLIFGGYSAEVFRASFLGLDPQHHPAGPQSRLPGLLHSWRQMRQSQAFQRVRRLAFGR